MHATHSRVQYNDKTIARYDKLITELGTNPLFANHRYNIWTPAGVVERTGAHFICDGGYHNWKTLMCGLKLTSDVPSHIWSIQMESVRKDIECCFGILKVRFKVLSYPIQYHSKKTKKVADFIRRVCMNIYFIDCYIGIHF